MSSSNFLHSLEEVDGFSYLNYNFQSIRRNITPRYIFYENSRRGPIENYVVQGIDYGTQEGEVVYATQLRRS